MQNLQRLTAAPRWLPVHSIGPLTSALLKSWLTDKGSLTARLLARFDGDFHVEVVSQYWGKPRMDEALTLGIPLRDRVLIREVILHAGGKPCVYARSILPHRSLVGRLRVLRKLDDQPLGAWLFKQRGMYRDAIQVANFHHLDHLIPKAALDSAPLWGRRSVFYVDNKSLLVGETFLEPLFDGVS